MYHVGRSARLLVGASALPILVIGALTLWTIGQERSAQARLDRVDAVIQQIDELVQRSADLETAQRGYLITGDSALPRAYRAAARDASSAIAQARKLADPSPAIATRLDSVGDALAHGSPCRQRAWERNDG